MDILFNRFPGGKTKVLTLSYDDGVTQDRRFIDKLNQYGLKGTFHLNSGFLGTNRCIEQAEVSSLYAGHEVAVHTVQHPNLTEIPKERVVHEIMEDRKALEKLARYPVRGMSYPNGSHSSDVEQMLPTLGIVYARTTISTAGYRMPDRFLHWNPTIHHNEGLVERMKEFLQLPVWYGTALMYIWGHTYEFDHDRNWELVDRLGELAGGHGDVWLATNMQIYDYIQAQRALQCSARGDIIYNPSAMPVWVSAAGAALEIPAGALVHL